MQVQNISSHHNKTSFNGTINIIPGDLSYYPARCVRKAYASIKKLINDKPFDLFIRQNHEDGSVSIIAQKARPFWRKNKPSVESSIADVAHKDIGTCIGDRDVVDLYIAVAKNTVLKYEEKYPQKTFGEKLQAGLDKAWHKFLKTMEIEDEVAKK